MILSFLVRILSNFIDPRFTVKLDLVGVIVVFEVERVAPRPQLHPLQDHFVGCGHPSPGISLNPGLTTLISGLRRLLECAFSTNFFWVFDGGKVSFEMV